MARQLSCPPHLTNVSTLPCKTYRTSFVAVHYKHALFSDILRMRRKTFMSLCGRYIQNYYSNFFQNQPRFTEDMTKTFWLTFYCDTVLEFSKNTTFKFYKAT